MGTSRLPEALLIRYNAMVCCKCTTLRECTPTHTRSCSSARVRSVWLKVPWAAR